MGNKVCNIEECGRKLWAKGYCDSHYKRFRRSGFKDFNKSPVFKKNNDVAGMSRSKIYKLWDGIIRRCENKNHHSYKHYGGRGIKVCERWRSSFVNFYEDMGDKPSRIHSIDRIDNNGDYEPGNCKWSTPAEQAQNRRMNPRNTSGHTGISLEQGKYWRVSFERQSKRIRKNFTNKEDAVKYRRELESLWIKNTIDNNNDI